MKTPLFAVAFLGIVVSLVHAQGADGQIRVGVHATSACEEGHLGLAGWIVFPDVTQPSQLRGLTVAGVLVKGKGNRNTVNRLEILGGSFSDGAGAHLTVDFRSFFRVLGLDVFWEALSLHYGDDLVGNKLLLETIVTRKLQIGQVKWGVGTGSNVFPVGPLFAADRRNLSGVGPRLVLFLPGKSTLAAEYQFRNRKGAMFRLNFLWSP